MILSLVYISIILPVLYIGIISALPLRLHHIAACINAQEDEQQDGEAP